MSIEPRDTYVRKEIALASEEYGEYCRIIDRKSGGRTGVAKIMALGCVSAFLAGPRVQFWTSGYFRRRQGGREIS